MTRLYANNAVGALLNAALTTDTTLTLQSGQGVKFPAITTGNNFLLTLIGITNGAETSWEIVNVTARATDVLTVVRAQEGTTAAAWPASTGVELRFTAGAALASGGLVDVFVTATTQAATAGNQYWLKNAALTAVTLPTAPVEGNAPIGLKAANGLATNTIDPGTNTIEGVSGVLTLSNAAAPVVLQFVNASWRFK